MIQRGGPWLSQEKGQPRVLGSERSVLLCGCFVLVGRRLDTLQVATAAHSCSVRHVIRMREWREKLNAVPPSNRALIDVVDETLMLFDEGGAL